MDIQEFTSQLYNLSAEEEGLEPSTNETFNFSAEKMGAQAFYSSEDKRNVIMFLLVTDTETKKTYSLSQFSLLFPEIEEIDYVEKVVSHYFSYGLTFASNFMDIQEAIDSYCEGDWYYKDLVNTYCIHELSGQEVHELRKIHNQKDQNEKQKLIKKFCQYYDFSKSGFKLIEELGATKVALQAI
ncbi:MAG TPA: hypothetical protein DCL21_01670 [Alphaproteobacteria bacterium]|nr:hypothetical protein [Alphaproteobacteria bacterium]